jgi:hypothetical protein
LHSDPLLTAAQATQSSQSTFLQDIEGADIHILCLQAVHYGQTSQLDVLGANRSELRSQRQALEVRFSQYQLYRDVDPRTAGNGAIPNQVQQSFI